MGISCFPLIIVPRAIMNIDNLTYTPDSGMKKEFCISSFIAEVMLVIM